MHCIVGYIVRIVFTSALHEECMLVKVNDVMAQLNVICFKVNNWAILKSTCIRFVVLNVLTSQSCSQYP